MRKRIVELLICPNTHQGSIRVFAHELRRHEDILYNIDDPLMEKDDDIVSGVLINEKSNMAYPIFDSIALMLSDTDTDILHHVELLKSIREYSPGAYKDAIDQTVSRLAERTSNKDGEWNREEMSYYDRGVKGENLHEKCLYEIRNKPIWALLIPRQKHLIRHFAPMSKGKLVLEVGCGNARTISWIFDPREHQNKYVGIDISWHRLLIAKSVVPDGDFIQASAFNLPFKQGVFDIIIGFGIFHHLPRSIDGIRNCVTKLSPNGLLAIHEPIDTPKLFSDQSLVKNLINRWFQEYEHSEHDRELDLEGTLALLNEASFRIVNLRYSHSIVYPLLNKIGKSLSKSLVNKKGFVQTSFFIDQIVIKTLCRLTKHFGPRAVILLAQKS